MTRKHYDDEIALELVRRGAPKTPAQKLVTIDDYTKALTESAQKIEQGVWANTTHYPAIAKKK